MSFVDELVGTGGPQMDYIVPIIEQLARAARELRSRHVVFHRLGYILIDNAAELIVDQYVRHQGEMQRQWALEPKLSPRQLRHTRRGKFEDKLGVLVALGVLNDQEKRFASICHDYRNEVYHAGIKHQNIIQVIGGAYYRWCCELFGRLGPPYYSIGGHERPTPLARALIDRVKVEKKIAFVPPVDELCPYLLAIAPKTPSVGETLAAIADEAIEAVRESINFIQQDAPTRLSIADIVHDAQSEWEIERRLQSEDLDGNVLWTDEKRRERRNAIVIEMRETFVPQFANVPVASWRRRAQAIGQQPNDVLALNRYQDLRDAMAPLEVPIHELASKLDIWIQQQVDFARGK